MEKRCDCLVHHIQLCRNSWEPINFLSVDDLCFKINAFFAGLTSGFMPITSSDMAAIFVPNVPSESLVLSCEAYRAFRAIK